MQNLSNALTIFSFTFIKMKIFIAYILVVNFVAFIMFGVDKRKARRHQMRTSEFALMMSAFLGGSIGALLGMLAFRHKTKHLKFIIGIPVILALQVAIAVYVLMW